MCKDDVEDVLTLSQLTRQVIEVLEDHGYRVRPPSKRGRPSKESPTSSAEYQSAAEFVVGSALAKLFNPETETVS